MRLLQSGDNFGSTVDQLDQHHGCAFNPPDDAHHLGEGAKEELWSFTLLETSSVYVTVDGFDSSLYARQGSTCKAATLLSPSCTDSNTGPTETLLLRSLPAGTYWLAVDGNGFPSRPPTAGNYLLNFTQAPGAGCQDDAFETATPNGNNVATAVGPLAPTPTDTLVVLCPQDVDWWWFFHPGGDLAVVLQPAAGGTGRMQSDLYSLLLNSSGHLMGFSLLSATQEAGRLTAADLPPGPYAVKVDGTHASVMGVPYGFNLSFSCAGDPLDGASGTNNTLETASPVDTAPASSTPLVLCPQDVDWFSLHHAGGNLTVSTHPALQLSFFRVVRVPGQPVTTAPVPGSSVANGVLTAPTLPSGEYALQIAATQVPAAGIAYPLEVGSSCGADELEWQEDAELDARVPNNEPLHAHGPLADMIFPERPRIASLCQGDVDHLWFGNNTWTGDAVVTLGDAQGLVVGAHDVVLDPYGTLVQVLPDSQSIMMVEHGADLVVTRPGLPVGGGFVLSIREGGTPVAPAGRVYSVTYSLPPPLNDSCVSATRLILSPSGRQVLHGSTANATNDYTSATPACAGSPEALPKGDVFFTFESSTPVTASFTTADPDSRLDAILVLLKGLCGSAQEVTCMHDPVQPLTAALEANQPYLLVVDSFGLPGKFVLTITTTPR